MRFLGSFCTIVFILCRLVTLCMFCPPPYFSRATTVNVKSMCGKPRDENTVSSSLSFSHPPTISQGPWWTGMLLFRCFDFLRTKKKVYPRKCDYRFLDRVKKSINVRLTTYHSANPALNIFQHSCWLRSLKYNREKKVKKV